MISERLMDFSQGFRTYQPGWSCQFDSAIPLILPIPSRPFLHLAVSEGFTYDLSTNIVGGVCLGVTISNVQLFGVPLDPFGTYTVTVNSFLADGGDNFTTFAEIDPADRLDGGNDLQALVNYLGTFSPVAPPSTDRVNEL